MRFRKDLPEASSGGGNYLKLKDKESVQGIFMGEIYDFTCKWDGSKYVEVPEGDSEGSFRFKINFVVKEGAVYVPRVFENGATVYRQLAELHEEYTLDSIVVKITRNGTGTDTTYSILPLLKQQITKEAMAHLKTLKLHEFGQKKADEDSSNNSDEVPF